MWGMTPIDQLSCRIQFRLASYEGMYTPPVGDSHSIEYSGYNGGSDWGGIAVDPPRGVIIANYKDIPNHVELVFRARQDKMAWAPRCQFRVHQRVSNGAGTRQAICTLCGR